MTIRGTGALNCEDVDSDGVLTVPSTTTTIFPHTLRNCQTLKSLKLHKGVTAIGVAAFEGCKALGGRLVRDCDASHVCMGIWVVGTHYNSS